MTRPGPVTEPNRICSKCLRTCKQQLTVVLLECPRYLPRPFKSPSYRFSQLDLFTPEDGRE